MPDEADLNDLNPEHDPMKDVSTKGVIQSSESRPFVQDPSLLPSPQSTLPADQDDDAESVATLRNERSRTRDIERTVTTTSFAAAPHSIFSSNQVKFIVFMASWAGFFSPVSANIYFPALNSLSRDLHVSSTLINLTLTSYMIFQGLAPAFIGSLADSTGRRPAYFICFIIYIAANIGLALQNNYAALFVLRCLQSTGSSATIAMASAVVSDVSTPADRGKYMGFTLAGSLLGPAIGPVIGGVLAQFIGWRAIFWFLVILAGAFLVVFAIFFPETARNIVGNGSIAPKGLNMSLMNYLAIRKARKLSQDEIEKPDDEAMSPRQKLRFPNPLSCLQVLWDKPNALLLFYNGFLFAAFYDVTAIIPSQFARIFHFNDLQIGLCYIPFGCGALLAALINGQLLDRNFRRWCRKLNIQIKKGRDQDLSNFPIEKARLQIAIPATYVAIALILVFGWVLNYEGPLAVLLVVLFFASCSMSLAFNAASTLLVDFYPKKPATATAANNLVRCLLGAGATGVVIPMVDAMGLGWTFTFLSLFLLATSPMLWVLSHKGMKWRGERKIREQNATDREEAKRANRVEEGTSGSAVVEGGVAELAAVIEEERERNEKDIQIQTGRDGNGAEEDAEEIGELERNMNRRPILSEKISRAVSHESVG